MVTICFLFDLENAGNYRAVLGNDVCIKGNDVSFFGVSSNISVHNETQLKIM